jgi:hypothetical protein
MAALKFPQRWPLNEDIKDILTYVFYLTNRETVQVGNFVRFGNRPTGGICIFGLEVSRVFANFLGIDFKLGSREIGTEGLDFECFDSEMSG